MSANKALHTPRNRNTYIVARNSAGRYLAKNNGENVKVNLTLADGTKVHAISRDAFDRAVAGAFRKGRGTKK